MSKGILLFTDFHAHLFMEFAKHDDNYYTDRFKIQCKVLEDMLSRAAKEDLGVIFGGDLFHKRAAVDVRVFNMIYGIFAKYAPNIPYIYLLRGNHDSYDNSMGSESSLDTFTALGDNVHVVSTPEAFDIDDKIEDAGVHLAFMPYGEDIKDMKDQLHSFSQDLDPKKFNLLVAHLGIDGAKQGQSNHRLASAFALSDMYPDKFNLVYLGHYHLRQNLADNVWYGGSTMQLSFNDEGQTKGYDIIHLDGRVEFVPVDTPKFVTLTDWNDKIAKENKGNYIRLRLPEAVAKKIPDSVSKDELSNIRVEAQVDQTVDTRLDIDADDTPAAVVSKFMDEYYPDTKQLALEVLQEVNNSYRNY